jgi:hypothetical protein
MCACVKVACDVLDGLGLPPRPGPPQFTLDYSSSQDGEGGRRRLLADGHSSVTWGQSMPDLGMFEPVDTRAHQRQLLQLGSSTGSGAPQLRLAYGFQAVSVLFFEMLWSFVDAVLSGMSSNHAMSMSHGLL